MTETGKLVGRRGITPGPASFICPSAVGGELNPIHLVAALA